MGIFGSDYPPGCHSVPGDEEQGCPVCWGVDVDEKHSRPGHRPCICPECPECGEQGNPDCYKPKEEGGHGLAISDAQAAQKAAEEAFYEQQCEAEAAWAEEERLANEVYQHELAELAKYENDHDKRTVEEREDE